MTLSDARPPDTTARSLYRLGAAGGFAAVAFALVQISIEVIGWGIAGTPVPSTVDGWFALLQADRLLGLTELTGLQIPMFALLVPLLLALHAALRSTNAVVSLLATVYGVMGIAIYLASNTAFSMLPLSDQWAAATSDVERTTLLAAGRAMLAQYEGPGLDAGVFLVMLATLALSGVMFRCGSFGRATAAFGIVAGVIGLAYYVGFALPAARIFLLEAAAPFFLVWIALASYRLLLIRAASPESSAADTT